MSCTEYIAVISVFTVLYLAIGYLILVAYYLWGEDPKDIIPLLLVLLWWLALIISAISYMLVGPKWLSDFIQDKMTRGKAWHAITLVITICVLIATFIIYGVRVI